MITVEDVYNLLRSNPRELAEWMHNVYQDAAYLSGWEVQESTIGPWGDLPPENQRTMEILAERVIDLFNNPN